MGLFRSAKSAAKTAWTVAQVGSLLNPTSPPPAVSSQYRRSEEIKNEQRQASLTTGLDGENSRLYTVNEVRRGYPPARPSKIPSATRAERNMDPTGCRATGPAAEQVNEPGRSAHVAPKRVPISERGEASRTRSRER